MSKKTFVAVGMSGGVDSSVSAYLLLQQGYHVEGVFMKNWEEDDTDTYCSAAEDIKDAQTVCDQLGIPLHTINFAAEYWDNVFEYFLAEYQAGRTPNPDILCNKEIKFKAFLDYAKHLGADYIATGHYVRRATVGNEERLLRGLDTQKDQSYFLYALNQAQLSKSLFPVGELEKTDVRGIAKAQGFENHSKKDSTGICFIGERRFKDFLNQYVPAKPGAIKTPDGEHIGQHDGLMFHTIGQRQGMKIGGRKDSSGKAWYAADKDLTTNTLIAVQGNDHPLLYSQELIASQTNWITPSLIEDTSIICTAKIRYRQHDSACTVVQSDGKLHVTFNEPQLAVTPGQSIVFYMDDICLGGAVIENYIRANV